MLGAFDIPLGAFQLGQGPQVPYVPPRPAALHLIGTLSGPVEVIASYAGPLQLVATSTPPLPLIATSGGDDDG